MFFITIIFISLNFIDSMHNYNLYSVSATRNPIYTGSSSPLRHFFRSLFLSTLNSLALNLLKSTQLSTDRLWKMSTSIGWRSQLGIILEYLLLIKFNICP